MESHCSWQASRLVISCLCVGSTFWWNSGIPSFTNYLDRKSLTLHCSIQVENWMATSMVPPTSSRWSSTALPGSTSRQQPCCSYFSWLKLCVWTLQVYNMKSVIWRALVSLSKGLKVYAVCSFNFCLVFAQLLRDVLQISTIHSNLALWIPSGKSMQVKPLLNHKHADHVFWILVFSWVSTCLWGGYPLVSYFLCGPWSLHVEMMDTGGSTWHGKMTGGSKTPPIH